MGLQRILQSGTSHLAVVFDTTKERDEVLALLKTKKFKIENTEVEWMDIHLTVDEDLSPRLIKCEPGAAFVAGKITMCGGVTTNNTTLCQKIPSSEL